MKTIKTGGSPLALSVLNLMSQRAHAAPWGANKDPLAEHPFESDRVDTPQKMKGLIYSRA